jgi:hypothetical protein
MDAGQATQTLNSEALKPACGLFAALGVLLGCFLLLLIHAQIKVQERSAVEVVAMVLSACHNYLASIQVG